MQASSNFDEKENKQINKNRQAGYARKGEPNVNLQQNLVDTNISIFQLVSSPPDFSPIADRMPSVNRNKNKIIYFYTLLCVT